VSRLRRLTALLLVNLVVLVVAAEAVSLAVYYYQHGWLFYLDPYRTPRTPLPEATAGRLTSEGLHPYFGQSHRPGVPFDIPESLRRGPAVPRVTNNAGFVAPHDYPFRKTSQTQAVIGIFGGSVGAWFCQLGTERLMARLRADADWRDRELVPLCFAHEGYKQPQQLLVLSYYLSMGQAFDLVVNIDGFNEVALGLVNEARGLDASMPSAMHLDPLMSLVNQTTMTPARLDILARISRDKSTLAALGDRLDRTRSAAVFVVLDQYAAIVDGRYRRARVDFDRLPPAGAAESLILVTPPPGTAGAERPADGARGDGADSALDRIARQWAEATLLMQQMLAARGVPYVHVLQPNQYYGTRAFSADEARVAFNTGSPFKPGVVTGYPVLLRQVELSGLRSREQFVDATRAFDGLTTPMYMDDCCHYTRAGNERMADVIAEAVLKLPAVSPAAQPVR